MLFRDKGNVACCIKGTKSIDLFSLLKTKQNRTEQTTKTKTKKCVCICIMYYCLSSCLFSQKNKNKIKTTKRKTLLTTITMNCCFIFLNLFSTNIVFILKSIFGIANLFSLRRDILIFVHTFPTVVCILYDCILRISLLPTLRKSSLLSTPKNVSHFVCYYCLLFLSAL